MEIESQRSEVIRHGCLRGDGVNPLIHLSQFDPCAVLTSVGRKTVKIEGTQIEPVCFSPPAIKSFEQIKIKKEKY